jgi:hypothetical protein
VVLATGAPTSVANGNAGNTNTTDKTNAGRVSNANGTNVLANGRHGSVSSASGKRNSANANAPKSVHASRNAGRLSGGKRNVVARK